MYRHYRNWSCKNHHHHHHHYHHHHYHHRRRHQYRHTETDTGTGTDTDTDTNTAVGPQLPRRDSNAFNCTCLLATSGPCVADGSAGSDAIPDGGGVHSTYTLVEPESACARISPAWVKEVCEESADLCEATLRTGPAASRAMLDQFNLDVAGNTDLSGLSEAEAQQ